MPQYLSPGVYVEEVPGTLPIAGVGTSTAGFIGVVDPDIADELALAAEGEPALVTNWNQFKNQFGDFHAANSTLAHAVYGFFNNGGGTCWVTRIKDITDIEAVNGVLNRYEAIDEIAIVTAPGAVDAAVQQALIDHCVNMKDRFAILDGQVTTTISTAAIIPTGLPPSDFAALYFPQIRVADPVTKGQLAVPPSGHMAGIYARVDQQRGVHKAPANELVRGALGLAYSVSRNEQALLNPAGVNVIRNFNGAITVWGARTLGGDVNGETKYINVRRLLNFLRESIDQGTQFAVFEPNAQPLWQRIVRSVNAFLTNVWRDGALFGVTPEQAFYVKCDETTNPPEVREQGQVVTEIGVSIVKPAEFVIFHISQLAGTAA
jgi:phage tail sheath protein FI